MRLPTLALSLAIAHLVSGCEENEFGKTGCEPDPYLCQIFCTTLECVLNDDDAGKMLKDQISQGLLIIVFF